jgi:hypothetical protein
MIIHKQSMVLGRHTGVKSETVGDTVAKTLAAEKGGSARDIVRAKSSPVRCRGFTDTLRTLINLFYALYTLRVTAEPAA